MERLLEAKVFRSSEISFLIGLRMVATKLLSYYIIEKTAFRIEGDANSDPVQNDSRPYRFRAARLARGLAKGERKGYLYQDIAPLFLRK